MAINSLLQLSIVIDIGNGREHLFLESARSKKAGKIGNQFRIASI